MRRTRQALGSAICLLGQLDDDKKEVAIAYGGRVVTLAEVKNCTRRASQSFVHH